MLEQPSLASEAKSNPETTVKWVLASQYYYYHELLLRDTEANPLSISFLPFRLGLESCQQRWLLGFKEHTSKFYIHAAC